MFRKIALLSIVASALAFPVDALAWGHGGHWRGGNGLVRGEDGIWRYYGPRFVGPTYFLGAPVIYNDGMACYAYDSDSRQWFWICN